MSKAIEFGHYLADKYGIRMDVKAEYQDWSGLRYIENEDVFRDILLIAASTFGVRPYSIISKSRKRKIVDARCFISNYMRTKTRFTFTEIGYLMGGRDHSTIINQTSKHWDLFSTDDHYKANCEEATRKIKVRKIGIN